MRNAAAAALALALFAAPAPAGEGETPVAPPPDAKVGDARPPVAPAPEREERPRIEVAFVLDTTGSMGGLIETAKRKIWSIANEVVRAKPSPEVRLGLVAFRDRGDAYVTKVTDLDADLDRIYLELSGLAADGGGDGPESVNQGLRDAVTKLSWTKGDRVLKVIFLVGDAPPHMDYADDVPFAKTCEEAVRAGIVINTLRCGGDETTGRAWEEIAKLSEGSFASIPQEGSGAVATPFDERIADLGGRMSAGFTAYGEKEARDGAEEKLKAGETAAKAAGAAGAPASVAADRWGVLAKRETLDEEADLVGLLAAGKVTLDTLDRDKLPESLRGLSAEELRARVGALVKERDAQRKELEELQAKRASFLAEAARKAADGGKSTFDLEVARVLRAQAGRKGFTFEEPAK